MSQPQDQNPVLHERWLTKLRAKRPIAVLLVATAVIGGLATWADAFKKVQDSIGAFAPKPSPTASSPETPTIQVNPTISVNPTIILTPALPSNPEANRPAQLPQTQPKTSAASTADKPVAQAGSPATPLSAPTQPAITTAVPLPALAASSAEAKYRSALELAAQGQTDQSVQVLNGLAQAGHARAQYQLGRASVLGEGMPQSYSEAFRWFFLAAKGGLPVAQHNLAVLYQDGLGTVKDESQALIWFAEAARGGHFASQELLRKLGRSW